MDFFWERGWGWCKLGSKVPRAYCASVRRPPPCSFRGRLAPLSVLPLWRQCCFLLSLSEVQKLLSFLQRWLSRESLLRLLSRPPNRSPFKLISALRFARPF